MERAHEKVGLLLFSQCVEGMSHGRRNIFPRWRRGSQFKMRREENESFFFLIGFSIAGGGWGGNAVANLICWLGFFVSSSLNF